MCRFSVGNAVVPGGEHFPREGAFVRLAGEKRTNNKVLFFKAQSWKEEYISFIVDGQRGNIVKEVLMY
jgi:hypothetical protein